MPTINSSQSLVLVSSQNGLVVIPAATPLTRLNYFDGKFLRAQDLKVEQDYLRQLVRQSNQAGGPGVAHGFDLTSGTGDTLNIGQGLAIDPQGRVLLLPQSISVGAQELIDKSRDLQRLFGKSAVGGDGEFDACELHSDEPPVDVHEQGNLFLIVISSAEAYCGEEDVYGKLCEEACATSTDRPYLIEGVTVRAVPLVLRTPLPNSRARSLTQIHFRSRVASAYFEDERQRVASLISKFGLEQQTWCLGAAGAGGSGVAIGVLARAGATTVFLDPWIARRERIDTPAKRYWQWRMMMRPWDVFIAQVLQFQCQLHDLFRRTPVPGGEVDPCSGARGVINEAATTIADLKLFYESTTQRFTALGVNLDEAITFHGGLTRLADLNQNLVTIGRTLAELPQDEFLIRGGIVELPSAGYLPVTPGANATINQQVRRLMGGGVDLRFCVVRPDYVAHALEEAQHMERISLLQGLDDPKNKPEVDILVPNGEILEQKQLSSGRGFAASVQLGERLFSFETVSVGRFQPPPQTRNFRGAARTEVLPSGGGAFYMSCEQQVNFLEATVINANVDVITTPLAGGITESVGTPSLLRPGVSLLPTRRIAGLWVSLTCERNIFDLKVGDRTNFNANAIVGTSADKDPVVAIEFNGAFRVTSPATSSGNTRTVRGHIDAPITAIGAIFTGLSSQRPFISVDVAITLRGASAVEVVLTHPTLTVTLSADWGKQPLEATASILVHESNATNRQSDIPVAQASLKENPDVLSETNPDHLEALDALQLVATAIRNTPLDDLDFVEASKRLLFPAPPKPIDELLVRGTMDWVLFHRRRNKKCQLEVVQLPPPPPRRYAVVLMNLEKASDLPKLRAALNTSTPANDALIKKIGVRPVDIVEFDSGAATLVSQPDQIQKDWHGRSPGNLLEYGAIASTAVVAGEGTAIAQSRLNRIEQIVSSISRPVPNAVFEPLATIPNPLLFPDTDGTIVLVTAQEVATECHTVYRADNDDILTAVRAAIQAGNLPAAIKKLTPLGSVQFAADQVVVSNAQSLDEVVKNWKTKPGSAFHSVVAFAASQTLAAEATFKAQTKFIRNAIRQSMGEGTLDPDPGVEKTTLLPTQCPAFSIIAVKPVAMVCHTVYRARNENQFQQAVKDLQSINGGDIQKEVIGPRELISLGDVLFDEQTANVAGDGKSLEALNNKWNENDGGKVAAVAVVYQPSVPDEASRKAQAKAIAAKLNAAAISDTQTTVVEVTATGIVMPTSCPAFTIVLPEVPVITECMTVYGTGNIDRYQIAIRALSGVTSSGNIQNAVIVPSKVEVVGDVSFEQGTINVIGTTMNDVNAKWQALGGGSVVRATLVSRVPTSTAENQGLKNQAEFIRNSIGSVPNSQPTDFHPVENAVVFPTDCRAFLIILAQRGQ